MKFGLRAKLVAAVAGAAVITGTISALAARETMAVDLNELAGRATASGGAGFGGLLDARGQSVQMLVAQAALSDNVRRGGRAALAAIARQGGLSFLAVVDTHGRIVAQSSGAGAGTVLASPYVARALAGETVRAAAKLPRAQLAAAGLASQVTGNDGLALIAATPLSDSAEHTTGAIYGGVLLDHAYDLVDAASHALGGKAALIVDGRIISSTIPLADGGRVVDVPVAPALANRTQPFYGVDTEGGTQYLASIEPVLDERGNVVAQRWFGIPLATYTNIQSDAIRSLVLWGLAGVVLALVIVFPLLGRLSRSLERKSAQVRTSADELSVVIVGSEVSGDHVAQTRAAVERQGELLMQIAARPSGNGGVATAAGVSEHVLAASALNAEILGDVIVIDTLSAEMAQRTQQAVARVAELQDVAAGLDKLVNG